MPDRIITWHPAGCDPLEPDGRQVVLGGADTSPFMEVAGAKGYFLPPRDIMRDVQPGNDGSRFRSVRAGDRDLQYRFVLRAPGEVQWAEYLEGLAVSLVGDNDEPGTLLVKSRFGTSTGAARTMRCMYEDGLPGDPMLAVGRRARFAGFTLKFATFDPWWYSLEPSLGEWQGKATTAMLPFTLPFSLDAPGLVETEPLLLDGHVPTYPTWFFRGPFTSIRVTDPVSGRSFAVNRVTGPDETLRVVTAKSSPSVRVASSLAAADAGVFDVNGWDALVDGYRLFPVPPRGTVDLVVAGTSAASRVRVEAAARWLVEPQ